MSDDKGGSTLTGTATARLRKVNSSVTLVETLNNPITSNRTLYSQAGYTGHQAITPASTQTGALCVEVTDWNLITSKGLSFSFTKPLVYCVSNSVNGADMAVKLNREVLARSSTCN